MNTSQNLAAERSTDLAAIRELKYRHSALMDEAITTPESGAAERAAACWTEDGHYDLVAIAMGTFDGHEGVKTMLRGAASMWSWALHSMTNPIIEIDGDRATGRWCLQVHTLDHGGVVIASSVGVHEDEYARTPDGWRIARQRLIGPPVVTTAGSPSTMKETAVSAVDDAKMKEELVNRHTECELARDWEGALATMADEPYYEHYPIGIRVRGREAVKEMWTRLLNVAEFVPKVGAAAHTRWFTDDTVVEVFEWEAELADGTTMPSRAWAVFHIRDGLIQSERIYGDETTSRMLKQAFDHEEFLDYPGVERIPN